MFFLWVMAMYGYLATGAKWSYACLLWAAFGGIEMIEFFTKFFKDAGELCIPELNYHHTYHTFLSTFDNFMACLLLMFVDVIFAVNTTDLSIHRLAKRIPNCLQEILAIMQG